MWQTPMTDEVERAREAERIARDVLDEVAWVPVDDALVQAVALLAARRALGFES